MWDLFFIKGIVVIFRSALTILTLMEKDILKCDRFEDIYFLFNHFCMERLDTRSLMDKFSKDISDEKIEELRIVKRKEVMEMIQRQLQST